MDSKTSTSADCDLDYIKAKIRYHRENVDFLKNATVGIRDPNLNTLFQTTLNHVNDLVDMLSFAHSKFEAYKSSTQESVVNNLGSNRDERRPFRFPQVTYRTKKDSFEPKAPWKTPRMFGTVPPRHHHNNSSSDTLLRFQGLSIPADSPSPTRPSSGLAPFSPKKKSDHVSSQVQYTTNVSSKVQYTASKAGGVYTSDEES